MKMLNKKILSMLSLCQSAGSLVSGEFSCEKALQNSYAKLIIVASDASENTKKKFKNKSFYYNIDIAEYGLKEELGKAIGKEYRAIIGICDENFAIKLKEYLGKL